MRSPDPKFREKVARVCNLYLRPPPGSVVVCIDEKPMQALTRKHPTTRAEDGSVKREFEYVRHGTCSLLASFDVATGEVLVKVVKHRTADALVGFLEDVAARYPDTQVYVVWDNLNIHKEGNTKRWSTFNRRHGRRFHFVFTPLHASWVNQAKSGSRFSSAACCATARSPGTPTSSEPSSDSSRDGIASMPTRFGGPSPVALSTLPPLVPREGATCLRPFPKLNSPS